MNDPHLLAVEAIRSAQASLDSALREMNLGRSELAVLDCYRALEAAGRAQYHLSKMRGEP